MISRLLIIIRKILGRCEVCGAPRNEYGGNANRDEEYMCQLK